MRSSDRSRRLPSSSSKRPNLNRRDLGDPRCPEPLHSILARVLARLAASTPKQRPVQPWVIRSLCEQGVALDLIEALHVDNYTEATS